jgi:hypothetical protein
MTRPRSHAASLMSWRGLQRSLCGRQRMDRGTWPVWTAPAGPPAARAPDRTRGPNSSGSTPLQRSPGIVGGGSSAGDTHALGGGGRSGGCGRARRRPMPQPYAAERPANLLLGQGRLVAPQARIHAGGSGRHPAPRRTPCRRAGQAGLGGGVEGSRQRWGRTCRSAACRSLRGARQCPRAAGCDDIRAAWRLADLLAHQATPQNWKSGPEPAISSPPAGWPALLAEQGRGTELRARAYAGDPYAACRPAFQKPSNRSGELGSVSPAHRSGRHAGAACQKPVSVDAGRVGGAVARLRRSAHAKGLSRPVLW